MFMLKEAPLHTHVLLDDVVEDAAPLEQVWQLLGIRPHVLACNNITQTVSLAQAKKKRNVGRVRPDHRSMWTINSTFLLECVSSTAHFRFNVS